MSPTAPRTQACDDGDARRRLDHARKFLEVAQLCSAEGDDLEYASASAALAVLSGIAACDAACCKALGRRARGQDHREAISLVKQVVPGGDDAANALRRLLAFKDEAHYGLDNPGGSDLRSALRQANTLTEFASEILLR